MPIKRPHPNFNRLKTSPQLQSLKDLTPTSIAQLVHSFQTPLRRRGVVQWLFSFYATIFFAAQKNIHQ
jgi:hypothetical protein